MTRTKLELRRSIRYDRAREDPAVATARAQALAGAAGELSPQAARGVAAYLPTNAEPDVGPLLRALGVRVYVPRVTRESLDWVVIAADDVVGMRSGIPRPDGAAVAAGAAVVTELGVRLLLVPALAVDPANGTRLGYGAGWYDRLLAEVRGTPIPEPVEGSAGDRTRPFDKLRDREGLGDSERRRGRRLAVAVGVCRAADLVAIPREQHDEPLDGVLTEDGLVWFTARP